MCILEIYVMCLKIFDGCPADIRWVSWRYLMGVWEIFGGCPGDN